MGKRRYMCVTKPPVRLNASASILGSRMSMKVGECQVEKIYPGFWTRLFTRAVNFSRARGPWEHMLEPHSSFLSEEAMAVGNGWRPFRTIHSLRSLLIWKPFF